MVCDLLQKIELLHAAGTQFAPGDAREVVKTFYEMLTILDNKGLALLAFDGIIVAATAFTAEKGDVFHKRGPARWLAIAIIILSLSAAAACLGVSAVSYPFFYFVDCTPGKLDFANEIVHLVSLIGWRTTFFQLAWACSIVAIPMFLLMFWVSLDWEAKSAAHRPKRR